MSEVVIKLVCDGGRWWTFPWVAKIYEDGVFSTLYVGMTKKSALQRARREFKKEKARKNKEYIEGTYQL